ncbi:hypothetical protein AB0E75_16140 [Streptomyces griseoviridis]|jgi:hypothetical protein|uniref:Uncharacterized protein n=3 Tax=Streptomyces TaxID=1883 RepID=A0ABT9LG44_STRGD|nr:MULTISPECIES: hypothetical protein [Streptomyces]MDP9682694.1 hypothetical protein [Streptomyces griseoviridis]GGS58379.1 hypothetical protein GCM10010238_54560 [Streptomyces niveoruber]GGT11215.1 hypothetical protein GCM10010240_50790 [Streptomyces griseoviridis]GGU55059.1 hypothetical protein GCM10010259_52870 [Streptomyces daghestanicus]GHI32322.1 hypothetical protein Sdagh_40520 [Streptomyces daghestanicus]
MIEQVPHRTPGADPAGIALALEVAYALHPPAPRAPEVAPHPVRAHRAAPARRRTGVRG